MPEPTLLSVSSCRIYDLQSGLRDLSVSASQMLGDHDALGVGWAEFIPYTFKRHHETQGIVELAAADLRFVIAVCNAALDIIQHPDDNLISEFADAFHNIGTYFQIDDKDRNTFTPIYMTHLLQKREADVPKELIEEWELWTRSIISRRQTGELPPGKAS